MASKLTMAGIEDSIEAGRMWRQFSVKNYGPARRQSVEKRKRRERREKKGNWKRIRKIFCLHSSR